MLDVAGAHKAGIDSVLVTGGIHAKDIAGNAGEVDEKKLLQLLTNHTGQPTFTMPSLQVS